MIVTTYSGIMIHSTKTKIRFLQIICVPSKKIHYSVMKTLLHILCLILLLHSCRGHDDLPRNPIDELPPETHTGAQTFGCLIDGRAFTPQGGGFGGPDRGSSFQFIYNDGDSYYQFQVFGIHNSNPFESININLKLSDIDDLYVGNSYPLTTFENGGVGRYFTGGQDDYKTSNLHTGSITITHYDYDNRIVSGTFEFDVEVDGEIVKITDGRFDMKFTI